MLNSLIKNPDNFCDELCNDCIILLSEVANTLGISYGELNVYLFVIGMPALIVWFIVSSFINYYWKHKWLLILNYFIVGILIIILWKLFWMIPFN